MAITYWTGPGAGDQPLQSGDFSISANWSRKAVPDATSSVVLGRGDYIVSCMIAATLQEMSIGKGATFAITGSSGLHVEVLGGLTNNGTLSIRSASLAIDQTLVNNGTIAGQSASTSDRLSGGAIVNHGLVTNLPSDVGGAFVIKSSISNAADGSLIASKNGLLLLGTVSNAGVIAADNAAIIFSYNTEKGTLTNFSNTILTGGEYRASGTGVIVLDGTKLTGLGSGTDVVLDGQNAHLAVYDGSRYNFIEETLGRIDTGASLHLLSGHAFGANQNLDLHGALELEFASLSVRAFNAFEGSQLTGSGTITGAADLAGEVVVKGGTLTFTGSVTLEGSVTGHDTLALIGGSNKLLAGSDLSVDTLVLVGGNTRLGGGDFRVDHLTIHTASLDLSSQALKLSGVLELDGGHVNGSASLSLTGDDNTSAGASGFGASVVNTGTISVTDGTLAFDRALSGRGVVVVDGDATLDFGAGATVAKQQLIQFDGAATVEIAAPDHFAAKFAGFGEGATIELAGFDADATKLRWKGDRDGSGGTLKVTDATHATALHFDDGVYAKANFETFQFSPGVLAITYNAPASARIGHGPVFGADSAAHPAFAEHLFHAVEIAALV